jgi:hypothetical protein
MKWKNISLGFWNKVVKFSYWLIMYGKVVDRISQIDQSKLNYYEYKSLLETIRLIGPSITLEQRYKLDQHLKRATRDPVPVETHQFVDGYLDPARIELFRLPNLLEEKKPKQFKYKPQEGELFNRAKQKDDVSDLELQDHLSTILANQSQQLLENSKRFQTRIQKDNADLSEMAYELETINLRVQSARDSIKLVGKKTWTTTIMIWASILALFIIFTWTYLFIRFFSVRK